MKLVPMHDNIFVKRDKPVEKMTPAGLVIPHDAQKDPDTATVIAVGDGRVFPSGKIIKPQVSVGDRILISRFAGTEVNWGMEKRTVIPWGEVLGVVNEWDVEDVNSDPIKEDESNQKKV